MQMGEVKTSQRNGDGLDEVGSQRSDGDERQVAQDGWASSRHDHWSKTEAPRRGVAQKGWAGSHARTSWDSCSELPRRGVARDGSADTCASTSWNNHWNGTPRRGLKRGDRNFDRVARNWDTKCDDWRNDTSPSEIKRARAFMPEKNLVPDGETGEKSSCAWSPWPCQVKPSTSPWDSLSGNAEEAV